MALPFLLFNLIISLTFHLIFHTIMKIISHFKGEIILKAALEFFVGIILLTLTALLGANLISASIVTMNARDAQSAYVTEIENSDLAESVIDDCRKNAESSGYKLDVTINQIGDSEIATVSLTYVYTIPLINVNTEHTIIGYAR